jgi:ribosomal-protein-alanine N-acetyltransferase
MLLPAFSCNGIISEAINEVMNYGFNEMHLHSVEIIDPNNLGSAKVYKKTDS